MTQNQRIADGSVRIREHAPACPGADDWRPAALHVARQPARAARERGAGRRPHTGPDRGIPRRALRLAARHPDRVDRVVLLGVGPLVPEAGDRGS